MTFGPRAAFAFLATAFFGCAANEPQPELFRISPDQAYSDQDVRLSLFGAGLVPSFRIDPSTDQRVAIMDGFSGRIGKDPIWAPLNHFDWLGPEQISATLPGEKAEELFRSPPICPCDVEITDPRGRKAILIDAFRELGPDRDAPTITCESPGAGILYSPGGTLAARCLVDDLEPGYLTSVTWTLNGPLADESIAKGSCPFALGASQVECAFDVAIDKGYSGEYIYLCVNAIDSGKNMRSALSVVKMSAPPMVKEVTPRSGPPTGGTDVKITGTGFESDSQAYFGDQLLFPNGGKVSENGTVISGYTPAHPEGKVIVKVVSRRGEFVLPDPFVYGDSSSGGGL